MITIPTHIAIIMDGNRRWAKEHALPVLEGHRRVVNDVLEKLIEHASDRGIKYLTLWAWSTENWRRDFQEVKGIMNLLRWGFEHFAEKMHKKGMRIKVIGDISKFEPDIQQSLTRLVERTCNNKKITVIFALNYGGRDEIVRSIHQLDTPTNISEDAFAKHLDTAGVPDPELIIRTGGEKRLSGFLLWQSEYSELYFVDWYMPEFTPLRLDEAIEEYAHRKRRFGK